MEREVKDNSIRTENLWIVFIKEREVWRELTKHQMVLA
jgi:hypothetical protein